MSGNEATVDDELVYLMIVFLWLGGVGLLGARAAVNPVFWPRNKEVSNLEKGFKELILAVNTATGARCEYPLNLHTILLPCGVPQ